MTHLFKMHENIIRECTLTHTTCKKCGQLTTLTPDQQLVQCTPTWKKYLENVDQKFYQGTLQNLFFKTFVYLRSSLETARFWASSNSAESSVRFFIVCPCPEPSCRHFFHADLIQLVQYITFCIKLSKMLLGTITRVA